MKIPKSAIPLALATAGCALFSAGAIAQSMEVVTVEAVREIVVGKSAIGAPIKEYSIRSRVSYADLDLTTTAGTKELEKRVGEAAAATCKEINTGFDIPMEGWTEAKCAKEAVADAMLQVNKAVEAAQAARR
jgi:UrcA family protein